MDRGLTGYVDALDALFARTGATSKYGLDRTLAFLDRLGNPHHRMRALHVAGTNGKGSVVAMLYSLLRDKGLSVARYTSPHLIDFRERIVVDDELIAEDFILDFLESWRAPAEELGATFFEITTAMAFHYFDQRKVDVAVIETGLGGRLDATNVIRPIVSGITSISLDHVEYLGSTESQIAAEKAGIFKPEVPSVIGAMSLEARDAILRTAATAGARDVVHASTTFRTSNVNVRAHATEFTMTHGAESKHLSTGLIGKAQAGNASVAMAMLDAAGPEWAVTLDRASIVLPSVKLPGRFQRLGKYILDVAHNPDGMRVLAETLEVVDADRPVTAIVGILNDKNWREMLVHLAPHVDRILLVSPPTAPAQRAWNPAEALAFASASGIEAELADFETAVSLAPNYSGTVLITGSFHTTGDALQLINAKGLHASNLC